VDLGDLDGPRFAEVHQPELLATQQVPCPLMDLMDLWALGQFARPRSLPQTLPTVVGARLFAVGLGKVHQVHQID
jgi:hypothetical protein